MMYRERHKTKSRVQSLWSVLKYDLGTAIDVLGLPCLVRLSQNDVSNIFHDVTGNGITGDFQVKFEKKISFYNVRARVCELNDVDWFSQCKGEEFVTNHKRLVGTEFFIPLDYKGKIRLADRTEERDYFSITEVIKDFPKFVHVMKDTACFSLGDINFHVIHKGSVLELDRVTQRNRSVRGSRDKFLICFDRENGREIAFRVMSPVHFRKVHDDTKYTVKDFIEHIQLPQKVEFMNVNPYDVIVADDDVASDILRMLSGPVELLGPKRCDYLIGQLQNPESGKINVIAMEADADTLEHSLVYMPSTFIIENESDYAETVIKGETNCDMFRHKLYSHSTDTTTPLLLSCDTTPSCFYDDTEPPDTPPLPPKYDFATLRSTLSEQHVAGSDSEDDKMDNCRRRFLSTGDLKGHHSRSSLGSVDREARGIKGYLSHLTHRFKSSASQFVFGIERQSNSSLKNRSRSNSPRKLSVRSLLSQRLPPSEASSFVCYLNCANENVCPNSVSENVPETYTVRDTQLIGIDEESANIATENTNLNSNSANHTSTNDVTSRISNQTTENHTSSNHVTVNATNQISPRCKSTNGSANQISEISDRGGACLRNSTMVSSEEVIYATVKKVKKEKVKIKNAENMFLCEVCREVFDQSVVY